MPEGPSIFIVREVLAPLFTKKKIIAAKGHAKIDMNLLTNQRITAIRSWGKHLLICLPAGTIRIHFLMFGTYSIDEKVRADRTIKLAITFNKQVLYFYTCAVKWLEGKLNDHYDWESDLLSKSWSAGKARKKLKAIPETMICDAILDQEIFGGAGNIIKNEALYRSRLHPEALIADIPARKLTRLIKEVHAYTLDFLKWKKEGILNKRWEAYTKKKCLRCNLPFLKKYCGKTKRRTYYCENCQIAYN